MKPFLITVIISLFSTSFFAQSSQDILGKVTDLESKTPLIGAHVMLMAGADTLRVVSTDIDGNYIFETVEVGRYTLQFSLIGYETKLVPMVEVLAGKQTVTNASLKITLVEMQEAEVTTSTTGEALNEMAIVSAREFSIEETERYAGSRGDPARMAASFAGVQGADDSRNDIVIRGNSPAGVLWRVEGVDIPNPNHFAIPGTAGGPVTILNNKTLSNSDFYTGAFPAEFGNSFAGVFDLKLRSGNSRKTEFTGQFGFLGTEALLEGPLSKNKRSSYLVSYRYSTLALFTELGIDIGTSATPNYHDGAFKLFFPGKKGNALSIWGFGGGSNIDILISDQKEPDRDIYGDNDRDQYFRSRMGVVGATYTNPINESTYLKTTVAFSKEIQKSFHQQVYRYLQEDGTYYVDSVTDLMRYEFDESKISGTVFINKRFNPKHSLRFGLVTDTKNWVMKDSLRNVDPESEVFGTWTRRWDTDSWGSLIQPFAQWKWRVDPTLTLSAGVHSQFFTLNNSISWIEPRLAAKKTVGNNQSFTFGYGLHSQTQSNYMYFYGDSINPQGDVVNHNIDMGFTRSHHFVAGHQINLAKGLQIKTEAYFQWLFDIPIESEPSSFSLVNTGAGFDRFFPDSLVNEGVGRNFGVEVTLQKLFSKGYYVLFTGSLFDAKYRGSDGVWRNTDFNGQYAFNLLSSKEIRFKNYHVLSIGGKITWTGGRWYGDPDIEASNEQKQVVYQDETRNTKQFDDYFRFDIKTTYTINREKASHQIGLDLINVTNRQNVLKLTYAPDESNDPEQSIRYEYQLGFLPIFYYRIQF